MKQVALPTISVVIPTYNCALLLQPTLESLAQQDYPAHLIEKLLIDGGSTDNTRQLAQHFGFRIVENPARSNLYGLPLGFAATHGELILHIDDDNVLDRPDWLRRMVQPFIDDTHIVAAEPLYYTAPKTENLLTRYIGLLGADDPLVVYAGFHERFSLLTNTWTGVPHTSEEYPGYLSVTFSNPHCIPSLACNAFLARRAVLLAAVKTPWLHMDGAVRMLTPGNRRWAKVKVGIINHHTPSIWGFFVKKIRRLKTRAREASSFEYQYPLSTTSTAWIIFRCLLIVPLLTDTARGLTRKPDIAWLLHPLLTLGTVLTYGGGYLYLRLTQPQTPLLRKNLS